MGSNLSLVIRKFKFLDIFNIQYRATLLDKETQFYINRYYKNGIQFYFQLIAHYFSVKLTPEVFFLSIKDKTSNELMGTVKIFLRRSSLKNDKYIEIGIMTFSVYRNRGVAKHVLQNLILSLSKHFIGVRIMMGTNINNLPMSRVMSGLGFLLFDESRDIRSAVNNQKITINTFYFDTKYIRTLKSETGKNICKIDNLVIKNIGERIS